jgi:hypothetical protein
MSVSASRNEARRRACIAQDKVRVLRQNVILHWTFPHPLTKRDAWRRRNFTHLFFRSSKTHNIVAHCASLSANIWNSELQKNRLTSGRKIKKYIYIFELQKNKQLRHENEQLPHKNPHIKRICFSFVTLMLLYSVTVNYPSYNNLIFKQHSLILIYNVASFMFSLILYKDKHF